MPDGLIHVVDDDAAMRASVVFLVESVGWRALGHASAEAFLAAPGLAAPGCVVLDIRMPTMSGLELQREIARRALPLPIVFITGHADVGLAVQAMKDGAFDFLQKPFGDQALLDAVAAAVRESARRRDADTAQGALAARYAQLTPRERDVARLVARGQPNKAIARTLGISEKTVHVHRARVLEKMGVRSAAELAPLMLRLDPGVAGGPP